MLAAALALSLGAADVEGPRAALWFYPVPLLTLPITALGTGGRAAIGTVGVGATVVLPTFVLSADVALICYGHEVIRGDVGDIGNGFGFSASVGPQFSFGGEPFSGWFLHPKLIVDAYPDYRRVPFRTLTMYSEQLGLDAGYQFRRESLYIAVMIGVSLGYGVAQNDLWAGPYFDLNDAGVVFDGFVLGLNLNLLRLGFKF